MMAFEPLAGKRIVDVRERKTKKDYAKFMRKVEQAYLCTRIQKQRRLF